MLHRAACTHVGETSDGAEVWGSMTRKQKVCASERRALSEWAARQDVRVVECSSCKP
jgi:hypothetical protein